MVNSDCCLPFVNLASDALGVFLRERVVPSGPIPYLWVGAAGGVDAVFPAPPIKIWAPGPRIGDSGLLLDVAALDTRGDSRISASR